MAVFEFVICFGYTKHAIAVIHSLAISELWRTGWLKRNLGTPLQAYALRMPSWRNWKHGYRPANWLTVIPCLPNGELIEEFAVSRTVAREAVRILASKGLVEAKPRFRPVVRRATYETALGVLGGIVHHLLDQEGGVKHLFDSRIFIESALVRLAAEQATKDDIAHLRSALEKNGDAIMDSDLFYETDMAFHSVLYTIPRNPIFPSLQKSYTAWLEIHWQRMPRLPERNRRNFASHAAILDGILNRDPDAAENALRQHLADAWEQVRSTFEAAD